MAQGEGEEGPKGKDQWTLLDAMKQLDQLNAMERQQDVTQWSSTALFTAANGVFLLALFSGLGNKLFEPATLYFGFGVLGLIICLVWLIVTVRAELYAQEWLYRAIRLQNDFKIPPWYSVWQDYSTPKADVKPLIPSGVGGLILIASFSLVWASSCAWGANLSGNFFLVLGALAAITVFATISVVDILLRRVYLSNVKKRLGL